MKNRNENFLAAHYDWLVAGVGALALIGGAVLFFMSSDEEAGDLPAVTNSSKTAATGVDEVDMQEFVVTMKTLRQPPQMASVPEAAESFLASEKRVKCVKCGKAIPADIKTTPKCPFCREPQL